MPNTHLFPVISGSPLQPARSGRFVIMLDVLIALITTALCSFRV